MSARRAWLCTVVAVVVVILSSPCAARAQGLRHDDPSLARVSDVIITGRVVDIGSARDPQVGFIYTYVTIAVAERIKGYGISDELVVKQLGGRVGDLGMVVYDQATFRRDEEVLLFLIERPRDGTLQTTALWQGKWTISRNPELGDAFALRTPLSARDRTGPAGTRGLEELRPLEPFLAELRAWSGPQEPVLAPLRRPLTHPAEMGSVTAVDPHADPAFTFLGPARWNQPDNLLPVFVDIQAGGEPGLDGGGFSELTNARNLWNGAGSALTLANGGTVLQGASKEAACDSANNANSGRLTIYFEDPCDEIANDNTLAVGGFFYSSSGGVTVNGTHFDRITSGYLINSDESAVQGALNRSRCFQDVQTHEMGHAIGLGHSSVSNSIMQPFLDEACYSVTSPTEAAITGGLGQDDRDAVNFIYPRPGNLTNDPSVPPGPPRGLSYTLSEDRVILEWLPPASGGPVASYQIQGGADPGRLNYVNFDTFQNATKINLRIKDGEYYIRVRAKNGGGSSNPSNEVHFVVEGNPSEPNPEFVTPTLNFASDSAGNIRVMGEIQNRFIGPGPATFIRVQATFLAGDGSVVGTDSAYVLGRSRRLRDTGVVTDTALAAGQRGCFMIVTNVPASRVANVQLSGSFSVFSNDPLDGRLQLAGFGRGESAFETLQVDGAASNVGSRTTYFNKVVFDVKTPKVQTCDFAFVQGSTIAVPGGGSTSTALVPGATGSFSLITDVPNGALEIRNYTQWNENAPAGSGDSLRALARIDDGVAADLVRLQADQARLWQMLTGSFAPSRSGLHRLRNNIEARLQRLERGLAPGEVAWRIPFAQRLRIPVRLRNDED